MKKIKVHFSIVYKKKQYGGSLVFLTARSMKNRHNYIDLHEVKTEILEIIKSEDRVISDFHLEVKEESLWNELFDLFNRLYFPKMEKKFTLNKAELLEV